MNWNRAIIFLFGGFYALGIWAVKERVSLSIAVLQKDFVRMVHFLAKKHHIWLYEDVSSIVWINSMRYESYIIPKPSLNRKTTKNIKSHTRNSTSE